MEQEYQKENTDGMFDFRKPNTVINDQIKKVERAGYKKLLVASLAFAAFLSVGLTAGNIIVNKYNSGLEVQKLETTFKLQQQQESDRQSLLNQQQMKDTTNLEAQKQIDFVTSNIKSIDKPTFTKFINYLVGHKDFYDERVNIIRKSLFEAQVADRSHAIDPNTTAKDLEVSVVNYKQDLEEVINKTSAIYLSVQNNHVKQDNVNLNDMKTFLKLYDQFSNGLVIHNKPIELKIKDIFYLKNKANVDYNNSHDMFNNDEKMSQEAEKVIKKFKP